MPAATLPPEGVQKDSAIRREMQQRDAGSGAAMTADGVQFLIGLNEIEIPDGRRAVDPAAVRKIAASIAEIGLRYPVTVRLCHQRYVLVAGLHRIEAFRSLGKGHIPAVISTFEGLEAELWEIDENLCRKNLSPAEEAKSIARRKEIYEALHPQTRNGGNRRSSPQNEGLKRVAFATASANTTGKSRATIERAAKRGKDIDPHVLEKIVGTSLDEGTELDALAKLPDDTQRELADRAASGASVSARTEVKKHQRAKRERDVGEKQRKLPSGRCGLIYADVPRHFIVWDDATGLDRSPENHYPTLSFEQLSAFPIDNIAAEDCILIFWSTAASLIDDIEIIAEWGFVSLRPRNPDGKLVRDPETLLLHDEGDGHYCSMQVWDKMKIGLGYWFRDRHEFILIAVRGNPVAPALGTQDESIFTEAKGKHSAKPQHVVEMIERLWPNTPKIELFCRGSGRPGWKVWGNETDDPG
jgi:N6-adenosine-specific RNA methylase IME4/ParB-like chromosome segregation protein Spo0J